MKILAALLVALFMTGCAGEIYLGHRRIDEYQSSQKMNPQPLKCLFVSCGNTEDRYVK